MVSALTDAEWLAWMERLVGNSAHARRAAEFPRDRFYCRLEEQPDHLVPQHCLQTLAVDPGTPLAVNPSLVIEDDSHAPNSEADRSFPEGLAPGLRIWLKDPRTEAAQPFWVDEQLGNALADARLGEAAPQGIPPHLLGSLRMAGVLVNPCEA